MAGADGPEVAGRTTSGRRRPLVVLVTPWAPPPDGIAAHSAALAAALGGRADLAVVTRRLARRLPGPPDGAVGPAGPPVHRLLTASPTCLGRLGRLLAGLDPDVVHLQYNLPSFGFAWCWAFLAARRARRGGARLVVTLHEVRRDLELLGPLGAVLLAAAARASDVVVVHTGEAAALLRDRAHVAGDKVVVVPHGAPPPLTASAAARAAFVERHGLDRPPVVVLGFLHPDKGIEVLLDAVDHLARRAPVTLEGRAVLVAGSVRPRRGAFRVFGHRDRAYRARLLARAAGLAPGLVRFIGHVPDGELAPLLATAAVLVLPYRTATQSGVSHLALAAGLPVVASDLPGLREALGEAATYVPVGDPTRLADALRALLDDDRRRRAAAAAMRTRYGELGPDVVAGRLLAAYDRAALPATAPRRGPTGRDVTVVVVHHDQPALLLAAVRSALDQRVPPAGVVVVDDASGPDGRAALDRLPPSVRVVRRPVNGGVVAARNDGLAAVATELVVFLDADDLLLPDFLSTTLAAWRAAAGGRVGVVYSSARRQYLEPVGRLRRRRGYLVSRPHDPAALAAKSYIANTTLLRVDAVRQVGGYDPALQTIGHEDWDLYCSLAEAGWTAVFVRRPLFTYRVGPAGRNAGSRARFSEVRALVRARHPGLAPAGRAAPDDAPAGPLARPFAALRDAAASGPAAWAWCLADLAAWTFEDRRAALRSWRRGAGRPVPGRPVPGPSAR